MRPLCLYQRKTKVVSERHIAKSEVPRSKGPCGNACRTAHQRLLSFLVFSLRGQAPRLYTCICIYIEFSTNYIASPGCAGGRQRAAEAARQCLAFGLRREGPRDPLAGREGLPHFSALPYCMLGRSAPYVCIICRFIHISSSETGANAYTRGKGKHCNSANSLAVALKTKNAARGLLSLHNCAFTMYRCQRTSVLKNRRLSATCTRTRAFCT